MKEVTKLNEIFNGYNIEMCSSLASKVTKVTCKEPIFYASLLGELVRYCQKYQKRHYLTTNYKSEIEFIFYNPED